MLGIIMASVLGTEHPVFFSVNLNLVRFVSRYVDMFVITPWRLALKAVFRSDQPLVDKCHVSLADCAQSHSNCLQLITLLCMFADINILD